ncbi:hypothetical protein GIB67_013011 [Kingdonia uniflora]|uniref:Uncharacterized protein n=1 Tax=Kingdonia uniflora TaxID=39325 RepID=A0A7J7MCR8_9MAGN|nr:hypothetical protein GIB67_013011 [Kingdonia uniflora]
MVTFISRFAELHERYFCRLPYDAVLSKWPLNLTGLDEGGKHAEYGHFFWFDMFQRSLLSVAVGNSLFDNSRVTRSLKRIPGQQERKSFCVGRQITEAVLDVIGELSKLESWELVISNMFLSVLWLGLNKYNRDRCDDSRRYHKSHDDPFNRKDVPTETVGMGDSQSLYLHWTRPACSTVLLEIREKRAMTEGKAVLTVANILSVPPPRSQSTKQNSRWPVRLARQMSAVPPAEVEKALLKRKRHEEEGSSQTNPHAAAKMAELELKYCSMAGTDPEQLDAEYYEHTFADFGDLTARFNVQSAHLKEFKNQYARVKELEAELKMEKENRAEEAKVVAKLAEKYSDLVEHDDVMPKSVKALKVRRYKEIEFPSEVLEAVMADAGISPEKSETLEPDCLRVYRRKKGNSRQASQQGAELTSARVRITELLAELEEEGKNVKDLQFQVNVLEADVVNMRARASKYEVLWLVADVLIKKMGEAHNRHNENINVAWNKVVTLEHTMHWLELNTLEHLDKNMKLRYANTKLDADLLQAEIQLDERRVEWENREAELDGSIFLIYHMDEKRRVEKHCNHLKTSLKEAQTKLNELILSKQVKNEAGDMYKIDVTAVISFFASEFQRLEEENKLVYDVVVGKSVQCDMEAIRCEYLGPIVVKIGVLRQSTVRDGKEIVMEKIPEFMRQQLYTGYAPDIVRPSNIGDGPSNSSSEGSNDCEDALCILMHIMYENRNV